MQGFIERRARSAADGYGARAPPRASFVLEGAQVACENGANTSSAADVFLTLPTLDGVVGTVDAAREARALVWRLRRRTTYQPHMASLPAGVGGSPAARRLMLSQQAEKKALAAQLALDYPAPSVRYTHRLSIDSHEAFKAASRLYGRTITCRDAAQLHVFERGACRTGDVVPYSPKVVRWRGRGEEEED